MSDPLLSEATDDELINALAARMESMVFGAVKQGKEDSFMLWWTGRNMNCRGLVSALNDKMGALFAGNLVDEP